MDAISGSSKYDNNCFEKKMRYIEMF